MDKTMIRSNHYEAAFEGYLQWHRLCHVAVDETRRSFLGERRVKSLDFIVYGDPGVKLLVDVKGRRYPGGRRERPRRVWESWSTREDIAGLEDWLTMFGPDYLGLLVFVYHIQPHAPPIPEGEELWTWHERRYLLRAITVGDYAAWMRRRSPSWGTVALPTRRFRELVRPFPEFLRPRDPAAAETPF